jgi:hypothetical protein
MPQYVLVNRRSGLFQQSGQDCISRQRADDHEHAEKRRRASGPSPRRSHGAPRDAARRMLLDADAAQVASIQSKLPPDSILEPAVRRSLHRRVPIELRPTVPFEAKARAKAAPYGGDSTQRVPQGSVSQLFLLPPSGLVHSPPGTTACAVG